jgi:hypothetical protein
LVQVDYVRVLDLDIGASKLDICATRAVTILAGAGAPLHEFGPSCCASVSERELTWWVCPLPTQKRHVRFERTGKLLPGVVPSFDIQLTLSIASWPGMADVAVARDWEPRTPQCVDDVVARQSRSPEFDQDTLQRCRSM